MQLKIETKQIIEAIGIIAVVASLIFVGYELRLARSIAETESFLAAYEINSSMRSDIAEHPDIWRKGCLGEALEPDEKVIFYALAGNFHNRSFAMWNRARTGINQATTSIFATEYALAVYRYPGIKQAWDDRQNAGDGPITGRVSGFNAEVRLLYEEFLANPPKGEFGPHLCGAG